MNRDTVLFNAISILTVSLALAMAVMVGTQFDQDYRTYLQNKCSEKWGDHHTVVRRNPDAGGLMCKNTETGKWWQPDPMHEVSPLNQ